MDMHDPFLNLAKMGFGNWAQTPLKGDASSRRFIRLADDTGQTAIAMHTPGDLIQSQNAFEMLTNHLRAQGLSAPEIFAQDMDAGLMVLEDLGPTDLATHIAQHPDQEITLNQAAIDIIAALHAKPAPATLKALTADVAIEMLDPFFEFYAADLSATKQQAITQAFHPLLASTLQIPMSLALRDYHAENLIWRDAKTGLDRIGVLDFQDAILAPSEYDLASLLRDARRDVCEAIYRDGVTYFAHKTGQHQDTVHQRCAVLGVQRNLRILGIFARLAKRDGKPGYLDFIPRVKNYIFADLTHPTLSPLAKVLHPILHETHNA